jgi:ABC-type transporter Mla maintaining outer membrane lipid asymmetry ATPase subunit MlaF
MSMTSGDRQPVIQVRGLTMRFGSKTVHENIDLDVYRGEVMAIVGGSGSGKSTLLREMTLLQEPTAASACCSSRAPCSVARRCWRMSARRCTNIPTWTAR